MSIFTRRRFLSSAVVAAGSSVLPPWITASAASVAAPTAKLTMLNSMAGSDFETAARNHAELGLKWMDLKDEMFGQTINDLSLDNARRVAAIARDHGLGIFCFSTAICSTDISVGESAFRRQHEPTLDHVLKLQEVLQPRNIRLISAALKPYPGGDAVMSVVERDHPWLFQVYGEMVDRIFASGSKPLIENETGAMTFARPEGILRFFERLDRRDKVKYTWDVQNLWQLGVFPTIEVYRQLKPIIGCIHLKGGRTEGEGRTLVHASSLEDASWAVADIMREAVADGVAPIICLNPSHGKKPPGFDIWNVAKLDVAFLRKQVNADL